MSTPNITEKYFLDLFEEFKKVNRAKLEAYINIATNRVPLAVWGTNTQYATALLAAHMLTLSGPQGSGSTGGPVTQETVGDLSRSYATMFDASRGDAPYMTTRYGIEFIELRRETLVTGMTTRGASRLTNLGC